MVLVFCLITLFFIAVIVYIIVVRRIDPEKGNKPGWEAADTGWLNALFDRLDDN